MSDLSLNSTLLDAFDNLKDALAQALEDSGAVAAEQLRDADVYPKSPKKDLRSLVGSEGILMPANCSKNNLAFPVTITDHRANYGHEFLVEPVGGSGSAWVKSSRVVIG